MPMKKTLIALLMLIVQAGCASADYENFGGDASLDASFDFPKGWRLKTGQGTSEPYSQAIVEGPRNQAGTFTAAMIVRRLPNRAQGGRFDGLASLKSARVAYFSRNGKLLEDTKADVAGMKAEDALIAYRIPPLFQPGLKNEPVDVKTRMVLLEKGGYLYEIQYSADASEFDANRAHFARLLKSFSLK
jgi:hypothetical protein